MDRLLKLTNKSKSFLISVSLLIFLSACTEDTSGSGDGSGSDGGTTLSNPKTGVFVDAAVAGVDYICSSGNIGVTNSLGEFTCEMGDMVTFSIAGISLGEVAVNDTITPTTLFPNNPAAALNLAQLLQTIDSDGDPSNGITPDASIVDRLKNTTVNLTSSTFDTDVQTTLGSSATLVTEAKAQAHLDETFATLDINPDGTENTSNFTIGGTVTGLSGSGLILQNNGGNDLTISANGTFPFTTQLSDSANYSVSVLNNPSTPNQVCSVSNASGTLSGVDVSNIAINCVTTSYNVSVSINGLLGSGLVLQNNNGDDLAVTANGTATFSSSILDLSNYAVTVKSTPTLPSQSCSVVNANGSISGANSTTAVVNCALNTFTIGGVITGLSGTGLVLQNNGGDNLSIGANGSYSFASSVNDFSSYNVSVSTNPSSPKQVCTVVNASGAVSGSSISNANINCVTEYSISGTVSGLLGSGLKLQNNLGDDLTIANDGSFIFSSTVLDGQNYSVTVLNYATSPSQTCSVSSGSGSINSANISSIAISCVTGTFSVGGSVSGLAGSGLVLQNNGGDNLTVSTDGAFTFGSLLADQSNYNVTVKTQPSSPSQICTVNNATALIASGAVTNVGISCVTQYSVGGTVTGLLGAGITLQNNAGDDLTITSNGAYSFNSKLQALANYAVTLKSNTSSPSQTCTLSNTNGTVSTADINNVDLSCTTNTFSVGGSVSGLTGSGLVLQNNKGDNLVISTDGSFIFNTPLDDLSNYSVSVFSLPTSPAQNCAVASPSGVLSGALINTVSIVCIDNIPPQIVAINPSSKAWAFSSSKLQSDDVNKIYDQKIATDTAGNAMAVWSQKNGTHTNIIAKRQLANGTWEAEAVISDGINNANNMKVSFNNESKAIAVWEQEDSAATRNEIWANIFDPIAGWAGPTRIDNVVTDFNRNSRLVALPGAINANAFVVWEYKSNQVWSSMYDAATSTWSTPFRLSDGIASREPQITMSPTSNKAMAIWSEKGVKDNVVSREFDGTNWVSTTKVVTENITSEATFSEIKMDKNGNAVAIWKQEDDFVTSIWSNVYDSSAQLWSSLQFLGGNAVNEAYDHQLEMDDNGNAIATWFAGIGSNTEIMGSYYSVNQQWSPSIKFKTLPNLINKYSLKDKELKFDANNNAIVMWGISNDSGKKEIWSNRYLASSGIWEGETLAYKNKTPLTRPLANPRLAFKPNGDAIVLYKHLYSGTDDVVVDYLRESIVGLTSTVTATFNETMIDETISSSSFTLNNAGSPIPATVVYNSASKTVTLTPTSNLEEITTYTASLSTLVSDSLGNSLGAKSWTFTTKAIPKYAVSGVVSGLVGSVVLQNNGGDNLTLSGNGVFSFVTPIKDLNTYTVSVLTPPTSPSQTCTVSNASGTISGAEITNVSISCSTNSYTVGGMVTGLEGSELTLKNNAGDTLNILANGVFTFSTPLTDLSNFAVTIGSQATSPQQTCTVSNGSGALAGANETSIVVSCLTHYRIGGVINGTPSGLVLQYNGSNDQSISSDGSFFFSKTLVNLQPFTVSVLTQPTSPNRTCTVTNPSGVLSGADAIATVINCTYDTFSIGGTISGLTSTGLVLQNKGTDDLSISNGSTSFVFATKLIGSDGYNVSIATQPTGQTCSIPPGAAIGDIEDGEVDFINISCVDTVNLGGTVSGLSGSGLNVQNNAGDTATITADGSYTFATSLANGDSYSISISAQPISPSQTCVVSNAIGTASTTDIVNANINCTTNTFKVSGSVSGLVGTGLVLQNNGGENKTVNANGFYPFFLPQDDGATYNVSVYGQPQNPLQTCTIANPTNTLSGSDITTVDVVCTDDIAPQVVNLSPVNKAWDAGTQLSADVAFAAENANVVADAIGGAIAIWTQSNGTAINLIAKRQLSNGTWESDTIISDGVNDVKLPNIAVDDAGNSFAVWQQSNGLVDKVWFNHYVVGSGWVGASQFVTGELATDTTNESQIVMSSNGDAMVIWQHTVSPGGVGNEQIKASKYTKLTNAWASAIQISNASLLVENPQVAINATNQAVAIWGNVGNSAETGIYLEALSSFYTEGSGWTTATKIDSSTAGDPYQQKIAMDNAGNVVAIWQEQNHGVARIWSNRLTVMDGLWKTPEQIERNALNAANFPLLVMDNNGNAIATWHQLNGAFKDYWSSFSSITNGWEKPKRLEHTDKELFVTANGLDIDASGNVIAVWSQQDDSNNLKIWANRFISSKKLWQGKTQVTTINTVIKPRVAIKPNGSAIALYSSGSGSLTKISSSMLANQSVETSSVVKAVFDESMMESSIGNVSFTINNGNAVSATVAYDSTTKTAALTPDTALARLSTYTATLDNSIADILGNTLAPSSWTFTTKDGAWGNQETISAGSIGLNAIRDVDTVFDKDGNAMAIWSQGLTGYSHRDIFSSYYDASTKVWTIPTIDRFGDSNVQNLPLNDTAFGHTSKPKIKFDGSGNAVAVWQQLNSAGTRTDLFSNRYIKGSGWLGVDGGSGIGWDPTVSGLDFNPLNSSLNPELVVGSDGEAMALYTIGNTIYANRYYDDPEDGFTWEGKLSLIASTNDPITQHRLGIDQTGNVIAVWVQQIGADTVARIWVNRYDRSNNTWGTAIALTSESDKTTHVMQTPELSVNASGDALVVWRRNDGANHSIRYSMYSVVNDGWSAETTVNDLSKPVGEPKIGIGDNGKGVAMWYEYNSGDSTYGLVASEYDNSIGWGTATNIVTGLDSLSDHSIITDKQGHAVASWTSEESNYVIYVNRYLSGQSWTGVQSLSNTSINAEYSKLAVDDKGNVVNLWLGLSNNLVLRRFD